MVIPNKYENLNKNLLVIGAAVLKKLKGRPHNIEELYQILKNEEAINLEQFFNAITFLWLAETIKYNKYQVEINKAQ